MVGANLVFALSVALERSGWPKKGEHKVRPYPNRFPNSYTARLL